MLIRSRFMVALISVTAAMACSSESSQTGTATGGLSDAADTIFTNAKVYTVDESQPWAEAFAVKDGRFVAVGAHAEIEAMAGNGTESVDLGGKFVTPGFIDTHFHSVVRATVHRRRS